MGVLNKLCLCSFLFSLLVAPSVQQLCTEAACCNTCCEDQALPAALTNFSADTCKLGCAGSCNTENLSADEVTSCTFGLELVDNSISELESETFCCTAGVAGLVGSDSENLDASKECGFIQEEEDNEPSAGLIGGIVASAVCVCLFVTFMVYDCFCAGKDPIAIDEGKEAFGAPMALEKEGHSSRETESAVQLQSMPNDPETVDRTSAKSARISTGYLDFVLKNPYRVSIFRPSKKYIKKQKLKLDEMKADNITDEDL